jgi:hypothetical protein
LTVHEIPSLVLDRAKAPQPVFSADEVADWPPGLLEDLVQRGIIKAIDNSQSIACDACGHDHVEPIICLPGASDGEIRSFISCPEVGPVPVELNRLRQWAVDKSKLDIILAATLNADSKDGSRFVFKRNAELWFLRFGAEQGSFKPIDGMVYIAHLLGNPDRRFSAEALKRLAAAGGSIAPRRVLADRSQEILDGQIGVTQGTRQVAADQKAIQDCENRLAEIPVAREAARQAGEIDKLDDLEEEEKKISDYLANGRNIRGGSRPLADSQRSLVNSVKQAIGRAMMKLTSSNPPLPQLHAHLSKALDLGNGVFEYRPAQPAPAWEF